MQSTYEHWFGSLGLELLNWRGILTAPQAYADRVLTQGS
jgi:hypothetical protein